MNIVTVALCAVIGGADDWVAVETFGRVFARLDPTAFQRCFLNQSPGGIYMLYAGNYVGFTCALV